MSNSRIRWMSRSDTDTVSEIRNQCSMDSDLMRQLSSPDCIIKVVEVDGLVAGFINYKNGRKRIRLNELAVAPEFRRMGVATKMIGSLMSKLNSKKIEILVPEHLLAAHMLLKKLGFRAVAIKKRLDNAHYRFVLEKCQKEECS